MTVEVDKYKEFIDGLVGLVRAPSYMATRLRKGVKLYPLPGEEEVKYNQLADQLTAEQRELVADLVQGERQGAIADVLEFLARESFYVTWGGSPLASEPFETDAQHDLIARLDGASWPDERSAS